MHMPLLPLLPLASAAGGEAGSVTETMTHFILQLAVILIAARVGGSLFRRYLKMPQVLGELTAGIIISPYALGGMALGSLPAMFSLPASGTLPVSSELYALATFASILLLFLAGLETDLGTFFRYSGAASAIGVGGIVFAFALGDMCAIWFGVAERFMDPSALFLGVISTATSVGITARILSDKRQTHTPEGASIMAAAVLDDVLGIILLAVVLGISRVSGTEGGGSVDWGQIGITAGKAFGFWLLCTAGALMVAKRLGRILKISNTPATITTIALGLTLLLAGLSEKAGLAMIIGAYIMGLALSKTDLAEFLQDNLQQVYDLIVPVFFCVMGMLVDLTAMKSVLMLGAVYTVIAILAKVLGCAIPAYMTKFNIRGSLRVGFGMLPRGEVALIVAGIGISSGIIAPELFGVSIMMTVITTLMAPPLLIKALEGGPGVKKPDDTKDLSQADPITLDLPSNDIAEFLLHRLVQAFRNEEFFVHRVHIDVPTYQIRKDDMTLCLVQRQATITMCSGLNSIHVAGMIVAEELLSLQDLLESSRQLKDLGAMEAQLMTSLFAGNK